MPLPAIPTAGPRKRLCVLAMLVSGLAGARSAEPVDPPPSEGLHASTPVGVSTHLAWDDRGWSYPALLPLAKEARLRFVRDTIGWGETERQKQVYALSDKDEAWIQAAIDADLEIILCLVYGNRMYENPLDPDAFAGFAAWMAERFKDEPQILAFEIWNEPNNFGFRQHYGGSWNGADDAPWLEQFAALVSASSEAIKRVDPQRVVITGGGNPPASAHMMMRYPEAFEHIDGLTLHPYSMRLPPESIPYGGEAINKRDGVRVADDDHAIESLWSTLQAISSEQIGRTLPLWVTEVGFSTFDHSRKSSLFAGYSESTQAAYLVRSTTMAMASRAIACWTIYDLMDDGTDRYELENNFGLLRHQNAGLARKPACDALQRLLTLLGPDAQSMTSPLAELTCRVKPLDVNDHWQGMPQEPFARVSGPMAYWFRDPQGYVGIVWMAGRLNHEFQSPIATMTFRGIQHQPRLELTNLVTGARVEAPAVTHLSEQSEMTVQVPMLAEPIAVRLYTDEVFFGHEPLKPGAEVALSLSDEQGRWSYSNGPEFTGAAGSLQRSGPDRPWCLSYDFSGGGSYTAASKTLDPRLPVGEIRFAVTDAPTQLLCRVEDQTGQVFQYRLKPIEEGGVLQVDLVNDRPQVVWGGAKDRTIHQPLRSIWLLASKQKDAAMAGKIYLTGLTVRLLDSP